MKTLRINRRKILRAIYLACLALAFGTMQTASAGPATGFSLDGATPVQPLLVNSGNHTITAVGSFSSYVTATGGSDTVTVSSLYTVTAPTANTTLITIDMGSVTNAGTLTGGSNGEDITINNTGNITNSGTMTSGYGVFVAGNTGTSNLSNSGGITATNGDGVNFNSSATVTNSGSGYIVGSNSGVNINGTGTVNNSSVGNLTSNYGISGTKTGISISGYGIVTNSGSIYGSQSYGIIMGSGTVTNSGSGYIAGKGTDGIHITNGGTVNNSGSGYILGEINAISLGNGGIVNNSGSGYISSEGGQGGNGVLITGSGTVNNTSFGYANTTAGIWGDANGVMITGNGTVNNSGSIYAFNGTGVTMGSGTVNNTGSASIYGNHGNGVTITGGGTVTNSSFGNSQSHYGILGTVTGVSISGYGVVTNSGSIYGQTGSGVSLGSGNVTNSGSISSASSTQWSVMINGNGNVTNSGTMNSGFGVYVNGASIVNNSGSITATNGTGVDISGMGTVTNSGYIGGQNGPGVYIGNGTVTNSGSIYSANDSGVNINTTGSVYNSGTINTGSATTHSIYIHGNGSVVNSGSMTSGYGIAILGSGSVSNSATGSIIGYAGDGIYFNGTGAVTNSGYIKGGSIYAAVYLGSAGSSLFTNGGQIVSNNTDSVNLNGGNSTVTVQARTNMVGTIEGNNNAGNVLNLNLVGMTPAQAAALNALSGSSSGTYTLGSYTYTWADFPTTHISGLSLEQHVDSGLTALATKIDNNTLPLAYDSLYLAALNNPEAALNNFSGREFLDAFVVQGLSEAAVFSELAEERADDLRLGSNGLDFTGLNVASGSMIASLGGTESVLNRLSSSVLGGVAMSDSKQAINVTPAESSPWAAWVAGTVTIADESTTATNPGFTATSGSPSFGVDYRVCPDFVLGGLFNFTTGGANFSDGSTLNSDTELFGLYADWAHDNWFVDGLVGGGLSSYTQDRATLSATGARAQASPDGNEVLANVVGGYDFKVAGWVLSPDAGLLYTHLSKDSFSETGAGAFDLAVGTQDVDSLRTKLGFNAARPFTWDSIKFTPEMHATWYHECLDDTNSVSTSVPGAPAIGSFLVTTNPQGRDFALAGAGLSATPAEWHDNVTFFVNYDAQVGQTNYIAHTINGGLRVNF